MESEGIPKDLKGTLPWTRACFVCGQDNPHGLQLRSQVADGKVFIEYSPRKEDLGWKQLIHGGIAGTLHDEVMTWAAMLAARRPCVSAEMTVRFRRPITVGKSIRFEADISRMGGRLIMTESRIVDDDGEVLGSATGKYAPMTMDTFNLCSEDFVAGPESLDPARLFADMR